MSDKQFVNLLFTVIVALLVVICASDDLQASLPKNDYVLRSCMSSVELSRRHIERLKSKLHSQGSRRRPLPAVQYRVPRFPGNLAAGGVHEKPQAKPDKWTSHRDRPGRQMIADTPLTTLKIERRGRKNAPRVFVEKNTLPVIESSLDQSHKTKEKDASIIVIEPAPRITSIQ